MYAVVDILGQQFKVSPNDKIYIQKLNHKKGEKVKFENVLLVEDSGQIKIGTPTLKKSFVEATVLDHLKDEKLIVFKKKRRKGYRVKKGHRQELTQIEINSITI